MPPEVAEGWGGMTGGKEGERREFRNKDKRVFLVKRVLER